MTTYRQKAFVVLLISGVTLALIAIVVATSPARVGKYIYYEYKGAERLDAGVGHAVPRAAVYWLAGGALLAFIGASVVRER